MTHEMTLFVFLIGFFLGGLLMHIYHKSVLNSLIKESRSSEEQRNHDTADWWKYGGDPFGKSVYDDEDDEKV